MQAYEALLPGAAERFFRWAEEEQSARLTDGRIDLEIRKTACDAAVEDTRATARTRLVGQLCGFGVVYILIAIAAYLAINHYSWSVVAVFGLAPIANVLKPIFSGSSRSGS